MTKMRVKKDLLDENLELTLSDTYARLNEAPSDDRESQSYEYDHCYRIINEIECHYENLLKEDINKNGSLQILNRCMRNKYGL